MVKKGFIFIFVFWIGVVVLMPKTKFYYKLEEQLKQQDIILNEKSIQEGWFGMDIEGVTLYAKGIEMAKIETITLFTLLGYSCVEINGVEVDDSLSNILPTSIRHITIEHSLLKPLDLQLNAEGGFGGVEAEVDLASKRLLLDFNQTIEIDAIGSKLKKTEKGWHYETSF